MNYDLPFPIPTRHLIHRVSKIPKIHHKAIRLGKREVTSEKYIPIIESINAARVFPIGLI